jgi:hypothetical protein
MKFFEHQYELKVVFLDKKLKVQPADADNFADEPLLF